jgi:hypothetical protein
MILLPHFRTRVLVTSDPWDLHMTKLSRRRFMRFAAAAAGLPTIASAAWAQTYPTRPVRVIVPFPPGGLVDTIARPIGQWLSDRLHKPFIIENRPVPAPISAPRRSCARPRTDTRSSWPVRRMPSTPHYMTSSVSISFATSRPSRVSCVCRSSWW